MKDLRDLKDWTIHDVQTCALGSCYVHPPQRSTQGFEGRTKTIRGVPRKKHPPRRTLQ